MTLDPTSNIQAQAQAIASKTTVKLSAQLDTKGTASIENQITRWNNDIKRMSSMKPEIFKTPEMQKEIQTFDQLTNSYRLGKAPRDDLITQMSNIRTKSTELSGAMQQNIKDGDGLSTAISKDTKKVLEWMIATTLIMGTLKQLGEGIQYIKDLNKELVNIQIVTGGTAEETAALGLSYNILADELGSTTLEVTKGSLEFIRQGKSIADTNILLRESTKMSKLANLDAAQSTEYMTSIMNGFQLSAGEMGGALDVLIGLDNAYATSAGEISAAMQRSANSAKQAGVSYDELASYITIISSVTRKSAIDKFGALWYNS
jgi:hypothetical protein